MRLPWISLRAHNAIVVLLSTQVGELKHERQLLLDRLATLGLGGPIFQLTAPSNEDAQEETPELADPEGEAIAELMRFRRRPARLADELTRKAYREYSKQKTGPRVAWVPAADKINAALDKAEEQGKRQVI